jgi:hypothetical protein
MSEEVPFPRLSECQRVESILQNGIDASSENLYAFFLWVATDHVRSCDSCRKRHPNAVPHLSSLTNHAEAALALEIDEISGQHLSEASEIARRAIVSRPLS